MRQSITTTLFAVLMSMVAIKAFAHDIEVANADGVTIFYKWTNNNTEVAVCYRGSAYSSYSNEYTGTLVIPKSVNINGNICPVTSIGSYAFSGCSDLTSVIIPNSVKSIEQSAFSYCSGLTSVTIPNSVTTIGGYAFEGCSGLNSITIPQSVTSIGENAFYRCSGLLSVSIPNSVTTIGMSAFSGCSGLTSVIIPNSVKSIEQFAFYGCSGLLSVSIPNSVTTIGMSAFSGCSGLTSVTIPNSVTSIGMSAFYGCSSLASVIIGNSVTSIDFGAFEGCSGLTSVTIPNSVESIGYRAFYGCSDLTSVIIGNGVTSIGENAFYGCSGLTSVIIGNSVTSIGNSAFYGCSGLTSIMVEGGNKNYDSRNNCNAIIEKSSNSLIIGCKNTIIPNSVTSIGSSAFSGCSGLTSVTIPNSVTTIGMSAFCDCSGLTSVTIPNSVESIGYSAFLGCIGLTSIMVEGGNKNYDSRNNCNAIIEKSSNSLIIGCKNTTIPNSVTSIGVSAFGGCSSLTSINIPNSVESIGYRAFYGCSGLTSVSIPNSVTSIGESAFFNCSGLKTIYSELETPIQITYIEHDKDTSIHDDYYFYPFSDDIFTNATLYVPKDTKSAYLATEGWKKFSNIVENVGIGDVFEVDGIYYKIGDNNTVAVTKGNTKYIGDVVIPSKVSYLGKTYSVTSIRDDSFKNCNGLTSVTIPNSVTSIGIYAFSDCSSLESIVVENGNTKYDSRNNCKAIIETESNTLIAGCKNTIIPNNVTSIGNSAFSGCTSLTSITIPNSVTSIGHRAFYGCSDLTSITIPNSVTSIGYETFYGTAWYNNQPDGLVYAGKVAYKYKGEMLLNTQITIKDGTLGIALYAFSGCSGLTSISIPNSVTSIGAGAFSGCSGLNSVIIPNTLSSLGDIAFKGCSGLSTITIPGNVTYFGEQVFRNCTGLTSVIISNGVTSIGDDAFGGCSGIISLAIPNSVKLIGIHAFSGCSSLTSVIVGNGITHIGWDGYGWSSTNLQEMILSQTAYENGIPESVTKFTTYSKNPMRVVVTSKGATSAAMKIYPIDDSGNTNEDNCYTVTMLGLMPGQYIKWKLDDENYGIISEKTDALALEVQPAKPTSKTKARLLAIVNDLDDDMHFGFEWLRYDAPDNMTPNKVSSPLYEGQIVGSLNNLNPDVYYKYRPYYKSDDGTLFYGNWESFITGDADVFFEPETHTKEVAEVTSISAQLAGVWIEGTEDIEEKGFEYWTVTGGKTRSIGKDVKTVIVSGNKTTAIIEGLASGKEYGYRSYVKTASGTIYGEEKTFMTRETAIDADEIEGDVNGDGVVNDADVKDVASHIIGMTPKEFNKDAADVNNDKEVNAADIVLINKIVNKK